MNINMTIKIDIACGRNKKEGFIGLDIDKNSDADIIADAVCLPIKNSSIDEINSSHFLEHLYPEEAQKFFDEIYRVLKINGKANLKVDRDWYKRKLLSKDPTHKYRYNVNEIKKMVEKFRIKKVVRKIYLNNFHLRNKIFVMLIK